MVDATMSSPSPPSFHLGDYPSPPPSHSYSPSPLSGLFLSNSHSKSSFTWSNCQFGLSTNQLTHDTCSYNRQTMLSGFDENELNQRLERRLKKMTENEREDSIEVKHDVTVPFERNTMIEPKPVRLPSTILDDIIPSSHLPVVSHLVTHSSRSHSPPVMTNDQISKRHKLNHLHRSDMSANGRTMDENCHPAECKTNVIHVEQWCDEEHTQSDREELPLNEEKQFDWDHFPNVTLTKGKFKLICSHVCLISELSFCWFTFVSPFLC